MIKNQPKNLWPLHYQSSLKTKREKMTKLEIELRNSWVITSSQIRVTRQNHNCFCLSQQYPLLLSLSFYSLHWPLDLSLPFIPTAIFIPSKRKTKSNSQTPFFIIIFFKEKKNPIIQNQIPLLLQISNSHLLICNRLPKSRNVSFFLFF